MEHPTTNAMPTLTPTIIITTKTKTTEKREVFRIYRICVTRPPFVHLWLDKICAPPCPEGRINQRLYEFSTTLYYILNIDHIKRLQAI